MRFTLLIMVYTTLLPINGIMKCNCPPGQFVINRAFWIIQCQMSQFLLCVCVRVYDPPLFSLLCECWGFGRIFTFLIMIEVMYVPSDCYYPFRRVITHKAMVCRIGFIKKKKKISYKWQDFLSFELYKNYF